VIGNTISGATYTAAPISTQDCGKFNVTVDQNIVTGR